MCNSKKVVVWDFSLDKVTGPKITHLRAETEFWKGEALLKYY